MPLNRYIRTRVHPTNHYRERILAKPWTLFLNKATQKTQIKLFLLKHISERNSTHIFQRIANHKSSAVSNESTYYYEQCICPPNHSNQFSSAYPWTAILTNQSLTQSICPLEVIPFRTINRGQHLTKNYSQAFRKHSY